MRAFTHRPGRSALMLAVLTIAALARCTPAPDPSAASPGEPASFFEETDGEAPRGDRPGKAPSLAPETREPPSPPKVSWPPDWRLLESGAFGTEQDSVSWYRLEGRSPEPRDAARSLLGALEPLVGRDVTVHVAGAAGEGATGQAAGGRGRAGVRVRDENGVLTALVMLHRGAS